jgi:hypothetical protein
VSAYPVMLVVFPVEHFSTSEGVFAKASNDFSGNAETEG